MSPKRRDGGSGTGSRTRRSDAERNRQALLAAAATLFDECGPEVPLDEIARQAGVANATLYRHFPTRRELILSVYGREVADLADLADRRLAAAEPDQALADWLRAFVAHVATKRELAQALPDGPCDERDELFAEWHATMHAAAQRLIERARDTGSIRPGVEATDLLTLATGIAMTGLPEGRLDGLLALARRGYGVDPVCRDRNTP